MITAFGKRKNVPKGIIKIYNETETQRQRAMEEAQDLLAELEGDKNDKNSQGLSSKNGRAEAISQGDSNAGKKRRGGYS